MYYPIIDKLKDVMEEIGQSGSGGGYLVIEATATSETEGSWVGSFSDIETAFSNNTPIYVSISANGQKTMFALICYLVPSVLALCTPISTGDSSITIALYSNNVFSMVTA